MKAMFTPIVLEIMLFEGRSVLAPLARAKGLIVVTVTIFDTVFFLFSDLNHNGKNFKWATISWVADSLLLRRSLKTITVFGVFLVSIFQHSNWIRRDTPYSVRMRENKYQKNSEYRHFSRSGYSQQAFLR